MIDFILALEPRSCIDGISHRGIVHSFLSPNVPHDCFSRIDSDPGTEDRLSFLLQPLIEVREVRLAFQSGSASIESLRWEFARRAPNGHDAVSNEFVDIALVFQ